MNFYLKIIKITIILMITFPTVYSQGSITDSLLIDFKKQKNDSLKINTIIKIYQELNNRTSDSLPEYWKKHHQLIEKEGTFHQIVKANSILGYYYRVTGNYQSALNLFKINLNLSVQNQDSTLIASSYGNIGNCNYDIGQNAKAIESYNHALKIFEDLNNLHGIAALYGALGNLYLSLTENEKAIQNYIKAKSYFIELNSEYSIATCDMNIGLAYKNLTKYNESLNYLNNAESIYTKINDNVGLAKIFGNLGKVYFLIGDYKKALTYHQKSLNASNKLSMKKDVILNLIDIAICYSYLNQHEKSIKHSFAALDSAKLYSFENITSSIYQNLYIAYKKNEDYRNSLIYFELYKKKMDSVFIEGKKNNIDKLLTEFETKEKEKEIEILNKDKALNNETIKHQQELLIIVISGFSVILILGLFLLRMFIFKNKSNIALQEQNDEINQQKEEIESQKNELEVQKELVEKQHGNITASIQYASHIQNALLPPSKYISNVMPDNFILLKPRDIVSGDFYWVAEKDNSIYYAAVDCTGHGVPGAFMSMLGISFLNDIIRTAKTELKAAEVLDRLKSKVINALHQTGKDYESKDGMDIALCKINNKKTIVEFAGANNPLYIVRNNKIIIIEGDRMPIGIYSFGEINKSFTNNKIDLKKDDTLYIFSDGYTDQYGGPKNKKFMFPEFKKLLLKVQNVPINKQRSYLDNTIETWMGDQKQIDDILIIGVKI